MKKRYLALIILGVLAIDQVLKVYIKTNYEIGQETLMLGQEWARLRFIENEGMAFGITFDWQYGKLCLTLFRILMVGALFYYIHLLRIHQATRGFIISVALITAGAIGNIIDSVFYGMIFSESSFHGGLATFTPWGQGYGTLLHGKVVDMFYFPIHNFQMPDWVPFLGGEDFLFFSPIFNVADAAITIGVFSIFLFQKSFFQVDEESTETGNTTAENESSSDLEAKSPESAITDLEESDTQPDVTTSASDNETKQV